MNLYLEVENFYKEFPGIFLLGLNSVSKKNKIYISHRHFIQDYALKGLISPGIVHLKDVNALDDNRNIIKRLHSKGFNFTAQDVEPGMTIEDYERFSTTRMIDGKTFEFIEFYFTWGQRDYDILKNKYSNFNTEFILSGSPKIDFLKSIKIDDRQKKIFKDKLGIKKKIILFPTSIGFPIGIRRMADWIHSWKKGKSLKEKLKIEEDFFSGFKESTENLQQLINLIRYLESDLDGYEIIIKSHPDEKIEDWKKLIDIKSDKIHYIDNISVQELMIYSDIIIQNGSSIVFDALILNKPIITYEPIEFTNSYNKDFPNSFGKKFKDKEAVKKYIKSEKFEFLANKESIAQLKNRLKNFVDENNSLSHINDAWNKILKQKKNNSKDYFKTDSFILWKKLKKLIKKYLNYFVKLDKDEGILDRKFPNINIEYVNRLHEILCIKNPQYKSIKIKKIDDKILELKVK